MRVFVYIGVALWIGMGVIIWVWNMILPAQMVNNLVPKPEQRHLYGGRQFQKDPADYTEVGQQYLKKAKRAELVTLA
ncbi:hypothetical protein [Bradyrhizobium sp. ORS 111]|uniref:hypothetical protein n=1 Tax=Bradyrhizobium sp. ORS 111 TaxID=1685958 RepID=UPI00388D2D73